MERTRWLSESPWDNHPTQPGISPCILYVDEPMLSHFPSSLDENVQGDTGPVINENVQVDTGPVITGTSPGNLRHLNPGSGLYLGDQSSCHYCNRQCWLQCSGGAEKLAKLSQYCHKTLSQNVTKYCHKLSQNDHRSVTIFTTMLRRGWEACKIVPILSQNNVPILSQNIVTNCHKILSLIVTKVSQYLLLCSGGAEKLAKLSASRFKTGFTGCVAELSIGNMVTFTFTFFKVLALNRLTQYWQQGDFHFKIN